MTVEPLTDWSRDYYKPRGGNPFVFFVVFGKFGEIGSVSRSQYDCDGIPAGIDVSRYGVKVHPETINGFREGIIWDLAQKELGNLKVAIQEAPECIVIRGEVQDPSSLNYLRDSVGFVTYLLDQGGCAVYDPQQLKYWPPSEWRAKLFEPNAAAPFQHTVILVSSETNGMKWFHTRGLRKFGRPDLSVHNVPADAEAGVQELINRFIGWQALGGIIAEGQEIRMKSLPDGLRCYTRGAHNDPDFNNVHVDIGIGGSKDAFGLAEV